jgi:hypothetical protein
MNLKTFLPYYTALLKNQLNFNVQVAIVYSVYLRCYYSLIIGCFKCTEIICRFMLDLRFKLKSLPENEIKLKLNKV